MTVKRSGTGKLIKYIILALAVVGLFAVIKARKSVSAVTAETPAQSQSSGMLFVESGSSQNTSEQTPDEDAGLIIINELMTKNRATIRSSDGKFYDWIELYNSSERDISLNGWSLSDKPGKEGWSFPDIIIRAKEYLTVFASGNDLKGEELHTDFSLSGNETVTLVSAGGSVSYSVECADTKADISLALSEDGRFLPCYYPTPGASNTIESFISAQEAFNAGSSILINEVATSNFDLLYDKQRDDYPDWIELKNTSSTSVSLSGWTISDSFDEPGKVAFPDISLAPGQILLTVCFYDSETYFDGSVFHTNLKLDSENEQLYLFSGNELKDYVSLKGIPYKGSCGRVKGDNGFFYFTEPTPGAENSTGFRYICSKPETAEPDGIFENVDSVTVTLKGSGTIYYTLDGSLPTRESEKYTSPIVLGETCVVRAIRSDGLGLDSRPLTASYIINEGHTVPVVSIAGDDASELERIYRQGIKGLELPGALEYFDGAEGFSVDCGLRMAGRSTLTDRKQKNMTFKMRGAYGQSTVEYDVFGSGGTTFSAFALRSGSDASRSIIRNEIADELCLLATDKVAARRTKWCVLYLNGEYYGLFALKDKINEDFLARLNGVSKESVQLDETPIYQSHEIYKTVIDYTMNTDMSVEENYKTLCSRLDIDSFIDWIIIEQYTGNSDIIYGNTGFYRSTELDDNRWKAVFYDLDVAFHIDYYNFRNFFDINYNLNVYAKMLTSLFRNAEFKDKYLTRVAELISGPYTNENVTERIKEMFDIIDPEVERDCKRWGMDYSNYLRCAEQLKNIITGSDYEQHSIDTVAKRLQLTDEERIHYFGR